MLCNIAGGIWRKVMSGNLAKFLPFMDEATRAEVCDSIYLAVKYPLGDPIRTDVIQGEWELSRLVLLIGDPRAQPIAGQ